MHIKPLIYKSFVAVVAVAGALAAASPAAFAQSTPHLYWTNFLSHTIGQASLDGTNANQSFISGVGAYLYGIADDGQHIYWADTGSQSIARTNLDGTNLQQTFIAGVSGPSGVAVDAQHIYWTNGASNTIGEANLDGSGVNQNFITGASIPQGLAVDGDHIYWVNQGWGTIGEANLDGTNVNQRFITGGHSPYGLAVDGQHIYWTNQASDTIGEANLDGTDVNQSLISGTAGPFALAVDGQHLYWTNEGTSTIGEANLDGTDVNESFITGTGTAVGVAVSVPVATVSSTPSAFPTTPQGELSAPITLTVGNSGQRDLSITGLTFDGADPGDFRVTSDSCPANVAPGDSCQIEVTFTPQAQGPRSATLRIATTDYANGPLSVPLSGTAGPPPAEPQGNQAPQGTQGPTAAQGGQGPHGMQRPRGIAGTIVCRHALAAKIVCVIEFVPGTYATRGLNAVADFTVKRGNRVVAHGTLTIRAGHVSTTRIRRLGRGRYTLTIAVGHGRSARVLLHEPVVIH